MHVQDRNASLGDTEELKLSGMMEEAEKPDSGCGAVSMYKAPVVITWENNETVSSTQALCTSSVQ